MSLRLGFFDSGVGGITVLTEVRRRFPDWSYVYFGDTAHLPYGTKKSQQIERLSIRGARLLRRKGVDALVVACNTASSLALDVIQHEMKGAPVVGMVGPGVDAVAREVQAHPGLQTVLVLATSATIRSGAYRRRLEGLLGVGPGSPQIREQACPLLVPLIEEGWTDHPILKATLEEYLRAHRGSLLPAQPSLEESSIRSPFGAVLLGCTHYPWIKAQVQAALPGWVVIDSAVAVVRALEQMDWSNSVRRRKVGAPLEWIFSDPQALPAFARAWIQ